MGGRQPPDRVSVNRVLATRDTGRRTTYAIDPIFPVDNVWRASYFCLAVVLTPRLHDALDVAALEFDLHVLMIKRGLLGGALARSSTCL